MAEGRPQDRPPESGARPKVMRPPNKKKYEESLDALQEKIKASEAELKSLGKPSKESFPEGTEERNQLILKQKALRAEKMQTIQWRKEKEEKLHTVRTEITRKGDILSKLEANLPFKTVEGLENALKNLEYQLQHKKLTPQGENRLVREIETLKRSRLKVREYNQKKKEIEADKERRKILKEEKDKDFNHVSALKLQEEQVKQRLGSLKKKEDEAWARYREGGEKREILKAEIDSLYNQKRQLVVDHKQSQDQYKRYMVEYREGERKRRDEVRRAKAAERLKQWKEYDESREPYEEERQTCAALIKYLQAYIPPEDEAHLNTTAKVRHSTESLNQGEQGDGEFTILRKKGGSDDELSNLPTSRRKKGRRQRRQSGHNKTISHSRQIFSQFLALDLNPPPTMSEVVETLVKLQSKLDYLEKLAKEDKGQSDISSSQGSDIAMSDYSAGTYDLLHDHDIFEEDGIEDLPEVSGEAGPRSLLSEVSKDDGIHSLSSISTNNDYQSSTEYLGTSVDTVVDGDSVLAINSQGDELEGITQDHRFGDRQVSQSQQMVFLNDHSDAVVNNNSNSDNNVLFNNHAIIPTDTLPMSKVTNSIAECKLGEKGNHGNKARSEDGGHLINGEANSNNSNGSSVLSCPDSLDNVSLSAKSVRTDNMVFCRTLSDTFNQNDIVAIDKS